MSITLSTDINTKKLIYCDLSDYDNYNHDNL